jgi:hypothetical protein
MINTEIDWVGSIRGMFRARYWEWAWPIVPILILGSVVVVGILQLSLASYDKQAEKRTLDAQVEELRMERQTLEVGAEAIKSMQIEAVKNGFAHWDVDYTGKLTFRWNNEVK